MTAKPWAWYSIGNYRKGLMKCLNDCDSTSWPRQQNSIVTKSVESNNRSEVKFGHFLVVIAVLGDPALITTGAFGRCMALVKLVCQDLSLKISWCVLTRFARVSDWYWRWRWNNTCRSREVLDPSKSHVHRVVSDRQLFGRRIDPKFNPRGLVLRIDWKASDKFPTILLS